MLPALGGLLGSMLFKKKGGKIVKQTTSGQAFVTPKKDGGIVKKLFNMTPEMVNSMYSKQLATGMMVKPVPKKKGGKIKKQKTKKKSRQKK